MSAADWAFCRIGVGLVMLAIGAASLFNWWVSGLLIGYGAGFVAWVVHDLVTELEARS